MHGASAPGLLTCQNDCHLRQSQRIRRTRHLQLGRGPDPEPGVVSKVGNGRSLLRLGLLLSPSAEKESNALRLHSLSVRRLGRLPGVGRGPPASLGASARRWRVWRRYAAVGNRASQRQGGRPHVAKNISLFRRGRSDVGRSSTRYLTLRLRVHRRGRQARKARIPSSAAAMHTAEGRSSGVERRSSHRNRCSLAVDAERWTPQEFIKESTCLRSPLFPLQVSFSCSLSLTPSSPSVTAICL